MSDRPLTIERREHGATAQLALRGELDLLTAHELQSAVDDLPVSVRHLIVDLRPLAFLDASGLHVLAAIDGAARSNGHNASFVRAAPRLQRHFDTVGLGDHFVWVDDPAELRPPTADPGRA